MKICLPNFDFYLWPNMFTVVKFVEGKFVQSAVIGEKFALGSR